MDGLATRDCTLYERRCVRALRKRNGIVRHAIDLGHDGVDELLVELRRKQCHRLAVKPTNRDLHHTEVVTCNTAVGISFVPKISASMAEWSARLEATGAWS